MFQRLLPDRAEGLTAADLVGDLGLAELAPADRPYVVVNMATTADGRVAIRGRSGPVAGEADRELFHELRTQADAVMAGAGTVRAERYRRVVKDALRERRERAGLEPVPLAVIVSGRLDLPADLPILHNADARVAIVTAVDETIDDIEAEVAYLLQPVTRELTPALHALRTEHGVRSIVCEGGPHLNSSLLREGLVDELWLCVSPRIGGDPSEPATVEGDALPGPVDLELVSLHEAESHLFFRYRLG